MIEVLEETPNPNAEPAWKAAYARVMERAAKFDPMCDRAWSDEETLANALMRADRLLSVWASFSKAFALYEPHGELSDYDDKLASDVMETSIKTLEWRDGPGTWRP